MKLVWNAIVKDERQILARCLASILPNVDGAVIVDTGSTDGTPEFIKQCFDDARKPIELHSVLFENFAQARNAALSLARNSSIAWDYLLLSDADMELVVEAPIKLNGGLSYDMWQTAGEMRYLNRRIINRSATGWYRGVTHEYLDIASAGCIDSASFTDYADGSNRPGKLDRDIVLLEKALQTETDIGLIARYCFYLGQSYFDLSNWEKAAEYYHRRLSLGGYEEECWYSLYRYALCLKNMGNHAEFVWNMLAAYERRPQRMEAFYELARFFRELRGGNLRSLLFSDIGMHAPRPDDALFVNDYVYKTGLKEEFSICAYYTPQRRIGARICNKIALDQDGTVYSREQARSNLFWYLQPLSERITSFKAERIKFTPPDGYVPMNPSIINHNGKPLVLVRTVNYAITPEGYYVSRTVPAEHPDFSHIITRNFLVGLSRYDIELELRQPWNFPPPQFPLVRGFEDSRLFNWKGEFWTLSTVRELTPEGWCEQVLAPLVGATYGDEWTRAVPEGGKKHEKNWMPWVRDNGELNFIYRLGTVLDVTGKVIHQTAPAWATEHISGGSQVIKVGTEYLALVHEARAIPGRPNRYYQHRFVLMDEKGAVLRLSEPFFFHDRQIEFAAGLALFGKTLMVSYGVRDEEAWVASMDLVEVLRFCG
jgi:glycosyltransferase involved in cell wall biosynthesis